MSGKVRIVEWTHRGKTRRAWGYTATVNGKRVRRAGWNSRAEATEAMLEALRPKPQGLRARAPSHDARPGIRALRLGALEEEDGRGG